MVKRLVGLPEIEKELLEEIKREERKIIIRVEEVKRRKVATIIEGIEDKDEAKRILKALRKKLACGGTYKNGKLMLQGDHRNRIEEELEKLGYDRKNLEII